MLEREIEQIPPVIIMSRHPPSDENYLWYRYRQPEKLLPEPQDLPADQDYLISEQGMDARGEYIDYTANLFAEYPGNLIDIYCSPLYRAKLPAEQLEMRINNDRKFMPSLGRVARPQQSMALTEQHLGPLELSVVSGHKELQPLLDEFLSSKEEKGIAAYRRRPIDYTSIDNESYQHIISIMYEAYELNEDSFKNIWMGNRKSNKYIEGESIIDLTKRFLLFYLANKERLETPGRKSIIIFHAAIQRAAELCFDFLFRGLPIPEDLPSIKESARKQCNYQEYQFSKSTVIWERTYEDRRPLALAFKL